MLSKFNVKFNLFHHVRNIFKFKAKILILKIYGQIYNMIIFQAF